MENTARLHYGDQSVSTVQGNSQLNTEHINTFYEQNEQILNVKPNGEVKANLSLCLIKQHAMKGHV
jgi:hypothetical protein